MSHSAFSHCHTHTHIGRSKCILANRSCAPATICIYGNSLLALHLCSVISSKRGGQRHEPAEWKMRPLIGILKEGLCDW